MVGAVLLVQVRPGTVPEICWPDVIKVSFAELDSLVGHIDLGSCILPSR